MRWIVRIAVALVVLVVVVGLGIYIYLDTIAQQAIERGGTYATGVPTRLTSVNVQPMAGEVALYELTIANPQGFGPDPFFTLDSGQVQVRLDSLMQERVVIPRLHLKGVRLNLQNNAQGQANYQVILANLEKLAQTPQRQPGKQYLIEELVISEIELHADLPFTAALDQPIRISDIRLRDVGSQQDQGVLMSQLTGIVVQAVLRKALAQLTYALPNTLFGALELGVEGIEQMGAFGQDQNKNQDQDQNQDRSNERDPSASTRPTTFPDP